LTRGQQWKFPAQMLELSHPKSISGQKQQKSNTFGASYTFLLVIALSATLHLLFILYKSSIHVPSYILPLRGRLV